MPLDVEVILALPEHQPVLTNLLEVYAHDFSEVVDVKLVFAFQCEPAVTRS